MTTLVVLQPGYLPWMGFFDLLRRADHFVYYDDVQFDKHGWRNRNRIKGPNGPQWLSVPVLHGGKGGQPIHRVRIDNSQPWRRKHIATLVQQYAKAPHVNPYLNELERMIERPWELLVDLDVAVAALISGWLGLKPPTLRSSELGVGGERNTRLVNLCRHFSATTYLSPNASKAYLDIKLFEDHGIQVVWQDYCHPVYPQLHGDFVPYLSAIDLVLNVGQDGRRILVDGNSYDL
jgi:hypothetical protein